MARPTWDAGWFQAEILGRLLTEMGYAVEGPRMIGNEEFYAGMADGSVDVWLSGWFPLHQPLIDDLAAEQAEAVGFEVRGGALQGYLVDLATADALGIDDLGDLANPEIASVFDTDGDGRAELVGCEAGWACGPSSTTIWWPTGSTAPWSRSGATTGPSWRRRLGGSRPANPPCSTPSPQLDHGRTGPWPRRQVAPGPVPQPADRAG